MANKAKFSRIQRKLHWKLSDRRNSELVVKLGKTPNGSGKLCSKAAYTNKRAVKQVKSKKKKLAKNRRRHLKYRYRSPGGMVA